jgi:tetrapyrrole methylase family protein/MazG family protein/ATP diphosphatase
MQGRGSMEESDDSGRQIDTLLEIMRTLRGADGCPWDAQQSPESLTAYILEESCELVEAIEGGDPQRIKDELGDLLLQVVFQAQIFSERGEFRFDDVAATINAKMRRRHPHVFVEREPMLPLDELNRQWEEIKRNESAHLKSCLADHLPQRLPTLQKAQKLSRKLDGETTLAAASQLGEAELQEVASSSSSQESSIDERTLGLALFRLARLAHHAGVDAEAALRRTLAEVLKER